MKFKAGDYIGGATIGRDDKEHVIILKVLSYNNSEMFGFMCKCLMYDGKDISSNDYRWQFSEGSLLYNVLNRLNKNELDNLMVELL